jgi:hypothetical protein
MSAAETLPAAAPERRVFAGTGSMVTVSSSVVMGARSPRWSGA